ncbi:MAG: indole-3-glycerol-phosphate synthase [Gracilibacteraceae bacterium]|jgi:indole-3-glycerol phosphate synthase|nr:indole-3-glycerol-phosphate synthase [Gracilibacteraceae bacterium]
MAAVRESEGLWPAALRTRRAAGFIPVIPDFKPRSPKEGELMRGRSAAAVARELKTLGAPALSVVTEAASFGGSLRLLEETAAAGLPVLRKDFIRRPEDLRQTREAGAAAVLLICALLEYPALAELFAAAHELGLAVLVEAHTATELAAAGRLGARLVGLNNRDIRGLERDDGTVAHTEALAALVPPGALLVSESGIRTPADARTATRAGADAVLVGSALWQAPDMSALYDALQRAEGTVPG